MTKSEAIRKVLEYNNGIANLNLIYKEIENYYPLIKRPRDWNAALRGIINRDVIEKKIKRVGLSLYALNDFVEENISLLKSDEMRMHSFIEGVCIEIGNLNGFYTYTADPTAKYNNVMLSNISTLPKLPDFTYSEIVNVAKRIDVLWFNKNGFQYPKKAIEVVDSINTLEPALKRCLQLTDFDISINIIANKKYINKINKEINFKPYNRYLDKYKIFDYDSILNIYQNPYSKHEF